MTQTYQYEMTDYGDILVCEFDYNEPEEGYPEQWVLFEAYAKDHEVYDTLSDEEKSEITEAATEYFRGRRQELADEAKCDAYEARMEEPYDYQY